MASQGDCSSSPSFEPLNLQGSFALFVLVFSSSQDVQRSSMSFQSQMEIAKLNERKPFLAAEEFPIPDCHQELEHSCVDRQPAGKTMRDGDSWLP